MDIPQGISQSLIGVIFFLAYVGIATEHVVGVSKTVFAVLGGSLVWLVSLAFPREELNQILAEEGEDLSDIAAIAFFLLSAMIIVATMEVHHSFLVFAKMLQGVSDRNLLVLVAFLSYFVSSILDNMTTTIVMITLVRKLIKNHQRRLIIASMIVIAANAGGAWTPIGDVTTTMLWIKGCVSTLYLIIYLSIPSIMSMVLPLIWFYFRMNDSSLDGDSEECNQASSNATESLSTKVAKSADIEMAVIKSKRPVLSGEADGRQSHHDLNVDMDAYDEESNDSMGEDLAQQAEESLQSELKLKNEELEKSYEREIQSEEEAEGGLPTTPFERTIVLVFGLGSLVFVPILKSVLGLPPYIGLLLGLGTLWLVVELLHRGKTEELKNKLTVGPGVLVRVDLGTVIFFIGILLAVAALKDSGLLSIVAELLDKYLRNQTAIVTLIGLASSVVDNVPLVQAAIGMYDLKDYPIDSFLWLFLAYAAGTGGSIMIIGSAAGVAAMGIEKISFFWYLKNVTPLALAGYLFGCLIYILMEYPLRIIAP